MLGLQPHAGRPAAEMDPAFREWVIGFGRGAYVVLYRLDGNDVVLLAIRHGREAGYEEGEEGPAADEN